MTGPTPHEVKRLRAKSWANGSSLALTFAMLVGSVLLLYQFSYATQVKTLMAQLGADIPETTQFLFAFCKQFQFGQMALMGIMAVMCLLIHALPVSSRTLPIFLVLLQALATLYTFAVIGYTFLALVMPLSASV